jgi:nucleoside-diphosphate-sugar epimerase
MELGLDKVGNQIFNVGSNAGNYSKEEVIQLIQKYVPELTVELKDLSFDGDMRDIRVSFDKIERVMGFKAEVTVEEGIKELVWAIRSGIIFDPHSTRNRNAQFIVQ